MSQAATALVFLLGSFLPHAGVPTVPDSALSLGGVSLGEPEAAIVERLGQPVSRRETGDYLSVELVFPGLTVWLGDGGLVGEILATSPEHCTPQGACPGQPFDKVQALYGAPLVAEREEGQFMEYYPTSDFPCWLQMAVESGTVRSIRAECQP